MATVSEQLRRTREEQKLNIYQVAEITKIKTDHIRALEAGDYKMFSAPVYIRGFVRTYAKALRLDHARLTAELDRELGQSKGLGELPSLSGSSGGAVDFIMLQLSKLNWRIVLSALGVALIIILVASAFKGRTQSTKDPLQNLGSGLYQPPVERSSDVLPVPNSR